MTESTTSLLDQGTAPAEGAEGAEGAGIPVEGWLKDIDPDIANDPSLKAIKDLPSLAKSYVHAQRMVGKERVLMPNEKSTDQDWKNFYSKLGMPDIKDYALSVNEKDSVLGKEVLDQVKELAYKNNLLPKQASELVSFVEAKLKESNELNQTKSVEKISKDAADLKAEWGDGFEKNIYNCQRVVSMFGDEKFRDYLAETGLDNDVQLIKFLNKVGENLLEDKFKQEAVGHLGLSKDDAQREINLIFGDMDHPYYNQNHPSHGDEVKRMENLFKVVTGNA